MLTKILFSNEKCIFSASMYTEFIQFQHYNYKYIRRLANKCMHDYSQIFSPVPSCIHNCLVRIE